MTMRWTKPNLSHLKRDLTVPWYDQPGNWTVGSDFVLPGVEIAGTPISVKTLKLNTQSGGKSLLKVTTVHEFLGRAREQDLVSAYLARDASGDIGVLILGLDLGLRISNSNVSVPFLIVGFDALTLEAQQALLNQLPDHDLIVNRYGLTLARIHATVVPMY